MRYGVFHAAFEGAGGCLVGYSITYGLMEHNAYNDLVNSQSSYDGRGFVIYRRQGRPFTISTKIKDVEEFAFLPFKIMS